MAQPLLRGTNRHPLIYIAAAAAISLGGSMLVSLGLSVAIDRVPSVTQDVSSLGAIVALIVVAPLIETLLMWPIIVALSRLLPGRDWLVVAASAALWAGLHAVIEPVWGLQIAWPFLVFSIAFLAWRRARSSRFAVLVTSAIHALQNAAGVSLLLVGSLAS